jgi:hypothetical protein
VASRVHALGLKFGIYSDAGTNTCAGYPGSLGREATDAAAWSSWVLIVRQVVRWIFCQTDAFQTSNMTIAMFRAIGPMYGYVITVLLAQS